jgi:arylsulfatase A-like enzyme
MDAKLGEFLDYLKKSGRDKNTIVIIQSEHGEDLGEHKIVMHYDIYDTSVHTPLIMRIPGYSGGKTKSLISGIDVLPTLIDLLQIKNYSFDGNSFKKIIYNPESPFRKEIFLTRSPLWEVVVFGNKAPPDQAELVKLDDIHHFEDIAVRDDRYMLIHRKTNKIMDKYSWYKKLTGLKIQENEYELYDLKNDHSQTADIFKTHKNSVKYLLNDLTNFENEVKIKLRQLNINAPPQAYF